MNRLLILLLLLPALCLANAAAVAREEFIQEPLKLEKDDYLVEALKINYDYWGFFGEVSLYRLDNTIVGGRELIDSYHGGEGEYEELYGEDLELRDVTADGDPEVVIRHNTGGNDPLLCLGLFVLRPTPTGFVELYADAYMAPVLEDLDGDGDEEIHTYSAYQSSFLWPRIFRAGFVDLVYEWNGEEYVIADPAAYRAFFEGEAAWREELYREALAADEPHPAEVLRDGQAVLAQLAVAGLDDEYAAWWAAERDTLRWAVDNLEEDANGPAGDWDEVYTDFHTPEAFRAGE